MKKIAYIIIIAVIITLAVLCIPDKTTENITYTNICYDDGIVVSGYITPNE